ncbi:MAG: hypothetical protein MJZ15_08455 [Bacteroidales bacterium]|nr:hypothetical protein [Bacteroidales bacterium]
MKKIFTFFVFALCAVCAWAQGTMTGADLAAMMGSTVYEAEVFGAAQKVYAKEDGNIYEQWGSQDESVIVEASAQVTLEGSTYTCPGGFTFHIEDGKVTKISVMMFDLIPSLGDITEAEFAALVGDDVYSGTDGVTIIAKNGAIYMVDGEGTETALHDMFDKFERVGEDFKFSNDEDNGKNIIFHPFGDKFVVSYYENYTELKQSFYVSADEAELVAAMGDREYVNPAEPWMKLHVENGKVCKVSPTSEGTGSDPLNEIYMLTKKDDNTLVFIEHGTEYDFHITAGKVTKVTYMVDNEELASYIIKSTTPIAQIGETIYTDVEEFIDAFGVIEGTATVKLLDDITLSEESQFENTNADADITLDLNGHNIIGSSTDDGVIYKKDGKLTIEGDGIVENTGDEGDAVGSGGTVVINEGTYIGVLDACFVTPEATIVINGGKFKAPNLYYGGDCINPIVKGGIFSMDPSDCLAVGYEVVENDDEETKGEYPYKVVELDVDITNPAGLLAVPQAGELDIKAYFTAPQEMMYSFVILHGEYRNLNDAIENSSQEDVVYGNMKPKRVATVPQAISVKDANIALEEGETYTIVVYGNPVIFDGQGSMFEIAIIPFTVGVGEINTIETISVAAGKLDIKASFSVSDEDLEAGATYMYALFEGKYASFIQLMSVEPDPVIDSEKITIKSDTENITLSSDEVELEAGKDYTLLIFDPTRKDPATGGGYPVVYAIINYTAVDNSTPTAIEGIDAPAAQKAVKTIENGKIVIIKNGEKYDLAGRKL